MEETLDWREAKGPMPKRKRKIPWGVLGGVIQVIVGLIEIGIIVTQCLCSDDQEDEEEDD